MQSLYQQQIMDHYHFPRHKGILHGQDCLSSDKANPSCGDRVTVFVCVRDNEIYSAQFTGEGCILSLAAADMLLALLQGKSVAAAHAVTAETIKKMIGIPIGPTRIKCILLAFEALKHALMKFSEKE